jgi:phosphoglucosamine mutase
VRIGCAPDGFNINQGFGATAPEALVEAVLAHQADYGVALDGDADRLLLVDGSGQLFDGDQLLYVMALDRARQGRAPQGVVGTLMTNLGVEQALVRQGIELVRAKVGDRYVLEELGRRGWLLGGEGSGHLLALDCHSTGDGLVSALQVLQAVMRQGQSLAELLGDVTLFPQVLLNVRLTPGTEWSSSPRLASVRAEVDGQLAGRGRVLLRASGTEPVVRVMVEADEHALAQSCAEQLVGALQSA